MRPPSAVEQLGAGVVISERVRAGHRVEAATVVPANSIGVMVTAV